jgi:hypothetical protein
MSKLVKEFKKALIECTEKEIKKGNGNCKFKEDFKAKTREAIDVFMETFDPMVDTKNDFAFLCFLKLHLDDTMLKLNEFLNWKRH